MRFVKSFGRFWYDFIIGDDWKIAAGVVLAVAVAVMAMKTNSLNDGAVAVIGGVAVMAAFAVSFVLDVRGQSKR